MSDEPKHFHPGPPCGFCISDLERARQDAERARAALERIGQEPCAFDGSYANCWEAIKADDIDAGEGIPCARCVALQALETLATPGPVPSPPVPLAPAELWCAKPRSEARKLGAFGYHFRADDDGDEPCVYCSPGCADASRHLAGPVPGRGLDPLTVEACAKVADEWAVHGSSRDDRITGRSIAGRIRSLASPADTKGRPDNGK